MDEEPTNEQGTPPNDLGLEGFTNPPDDQGLSLEDLSKAYAQLIDGGTDPYQNSELPEEFKGEDARAENASFGDDDDVEINPRSILEAMLFVGDIGGEPLTAKYIASLMRGVSPREIGELVAELNEIYDEEDCPYRIASVGVGYSLLLREQFSALRDKFYGRIRAAKLSQQAVDVLALVAYRQPLTTDEVNELRGRPSGTVLSQLVRRQLLRIERPETKPRKPCYFITDRFLDLFGMSGIEELPHSHDIDVT